MSREKGKRGEREWAKFLCSHGFEAKRGVQYAGANGRDDGGEDVVVKGDKAFHHEVKFDEKITIDTAELKKAMEQSECDCMGKIPLVAHRTKNKKWKVTMKLGDLGCYCQPAAGVLVTMLADEWIYYYKARLRR